MVLTRIQFLPLAIAGILASGSGGLVHDVRASDAPGAIVEAVHLDAPRSETASATGQSPDTGPADAEERAARLIRQLEAARTPRQLYFARRDAAALTDRYRACVTCRRVHARALERSQMWDEAARQWRRLLKLRADDAEALLALADYHVAEGLRYRTMVSGPISLSKFGYEDLEHAVGYLARLRQIAAGHATAEMRLAELALTLGKWAEAIRYATSAALFSNEPKARAVRGAALLRAGDTEEASGEFALFLDASADSIRALYNDPDYFFTRRGLDLRKTDQPGADDASAWDDRDPRLLTPDNERLLEHYARVTIAAVRCSTRPGAWDGMRTEPGVLLIRYGEPREETRIRPEIGDEGLIRYEELRYHYPEFTIVMDDQSLLGRFHLAGGGARDSLSYFEGVRLIKRIKELYDPHDGEPALSMASRTWVLPRGPRGLAVTAVDVSTEGLELQWDGRTAPYARFAVATRWKSEQSGAIRQGRERFDADEIRGCPAATKFSAAFIETLAAGTWAFAVEIEDRSTGRWARQDTTLSIPQRAATSSLSMFGPIPCWGGDGPAPAGVPLESTTLIPTAQPAYGVRDALVMYFEVQGLKLARWQVHQGSIRYAVRRVDRRPWWRRLLGGRSGPEVSVEVEAQGPGDRIVSSVEVQLPRTIAGAYEFLLHCVDDVGGATAKGYTTFQVCGEKGGEQ